MVVQEGRYKYMRNRKSSMFFWGVVIFCFSCVLVYTLSQTFGPSILKTADNNRNAIMSQQSTPYQGVSYSEDSEEYKEAVENLKKQVMAELYDFVNEMDSFLSNKENEVEPTEDDRAIEIRDAALKAMNSGSFSLNVDVLDSVSNYINLCDSYYGGYYSKDDFIASTEAMVTNMHNFIENYAQDAINQVYTNNIVDVVDTETIKKERRRLLIMKVVACIAAVGVLGGLAFFVKTYFGNRYDEDEVTEENE